MWPHGFTLRPADRSPAPLSWLYSPWLLLAWGALLRRTAPTPEDEPWSIRLDGPLALGAGLAFACLTGLWLPSAYLSRWPLTAADFPQYCESVAAVMDGRFDLVHRQRSLYAAIVPGLLGQTFGILGGLALAALASQVVIGTALFLWGRAVAGRTGGGLVVLLGACMGPLVLLARTASFYPEAVAGMTLASAGGALALRYRTIPALAAAGVGIGVVLLADVRGLYWALVIGGASVLAALFAAGGRGGLGGRGARILGGLAALTVPIAISWGVARAYTAPGTLGLTVQTSFFVGDVLRFIGAPVGPHSAGLDFVWGVTPPSEIPGVLEKIRALTAQIPASVADAPEVAQTRANHAAPWMWPTLCAAGLGLVGLRRRPWALVAWVLPAVPFAPSLYAATHYLSFERYLSFGFPAVAAVVGAGVAVGLRGSSGWVTPRWRGLVRFGAVVLFVLGAVPSWLSPHAPWRVPFRAEQDPWFVFTAGRSPGADYDACFAALERDRREGRTWRGYRDMAP